MAKRADPMIWGMWGGGIGIAVIAVVILYGETTPYTLTIAAVAGYFWGTVAAKIRNHLLVQRGVPLE